MNCGWINWNSVSGVPDDVKSGTNYDDEDRDNCECEKCDGVGFVW